MASKCIANRDHEPLPKRVDRTCHSEHARSDLGPPRPEPYPPQNLKLGPSPGCEGTVYVRTV